MKCKDCEHYKFIGKTQHNSKIDGSCQHPNIPFPLVSSDEECRLTRSELHCKDCDYWKPAEGMAREDDCGGCTYDGAFFPMFLDETCTLKEKYRIEVEKKMLK